MIVYGIKIGDKFLYTESGSGIRRYFLSKSIARANKWTQKSTALKNFEEIKKFNEDASFIEISIEEVLKEKTEIHTASRALLEAKEKFSTNFLEKIGFRKKKPSMMVPLEKGV